VLRAATNRAARRRALLAFSLLMAACAGPAPRPGVGAERPPAARIASFALDGRIAVRNGETRYSASVSWQHSVDRDAILLSGPLGQGLAELVRDAAGARLTLADHRQFTAAAMDQLSQQVFGVALPLSEMARWVVGDTAGASVGAGEDPQRPRQMLAHGWTIDLLERESAAESALPTLIEVHRDDLNARLKIIDWQDVR
jgi:outer membrane lipoprotein LolB